MEVVEVSIILCGICAIIDTIWYMYMYITCLKSVIVKVSDADILSTDVISMATDLLIVLRPHMLINSSSTICPVEL